MKTWIRKVWTVKKIHRDPYKRRLYKLNSLCIYNLLFPISSQQKKISMKEIKYNEALRLNSLCIHNAFNWERRLKFNSIRHDFEFLLRCQLSVSKLLQTMHERCVNVFSLFIIGSALRSSLSHLKLNCLLTIQNKK